MFGQVLARPSPVQFRSPYQDLMGGIGAGQQMAARAQQLQQAKQMQPYMVQQAAEKVPFMQAQEQKMQQGAQQLGNPLMGTSGSGTVGATKAYLNALRLWGAADFRTKHFKKALDVESTMQQFRGLPRVVGGEVAGAGGIPGLNLTPDQRRAINDYNAKQGRTASQSNMVTRSQTAENTYNYLTPFINGASTYAGWGGKVRSVEDALKSKTGLGTSSPNYKAYQAVTNMAPDLASQVMRLSGGKASDKDQELFMKMTSIDAIHSMSAPQFKANWQRLGVLLKKYGKTVRQHPSQIIKQPVQTAQIQQQTAPVQQNAQQGQQQGGMITMTAPNGKTYNVPANKASQLEAQGLKRVG